MKGGVGEYYGREMRDSFGRRIRQEKIAKNKRVWVFGFFIGFLRAFCGSKTLDLVHHHNEGFRFDNLVPMSRLRRQKSQQKTQQ